MRPSAASDARRLLRPLRGEILRLARALVRVDSVAIPPEGHETAAQKVLRRFLEPYRLAWRCTTAASSSAPATPTRAATGGTGAATT